MGSLKRKQDENREKIVTQFMVDNYFGPRAEVIGEDKIELQYKGVDIIVDDVNIDLKAQVGDRYINNPTNTFSLEVLTKNRYGNKITGWFLDDEKLTDAYGFIWIPNAETDPFKPIEIEYMQVDIAALKENLFSSIVSKEKMMKFANHIFGTNERMYFDENIRLVSSPTFFEQPVNLVVPKLFYKKFATVHEIIGGK